MLGRFGEDQEDSEVSAVVGKFNMQILNAGGLQQEEDLIELIGIHLHLWTFRRAE